MENPPAKVEIVLAYEMTKLFGMDQRGRRDTLTLTFLGISLKVATIEGIPNVYPPSYKAYVILKQLQSIIPH